MPEAELLLAYKAKQGELLVEMQLWRIPVPDSDRPHGFHFRLYFGRSNECLLLYDTHSGKRAHRHIDGREEPYEFTSVDALIEQFRAECAARGWRWGGE
jgi:hypothetical protein